MSFVEVFPVEPVTPTTRQPSSRRHPRASAPSACSVLSDAITGACTPASTSSRALAGPTSSSPGAGVERGLGEAAAVGVRPVQADEQVALADLARVHHSAPRAGQARLAGEQLALRRLGHPARVPHRSASRDDGHVVERLLAAVLELLALLVPLAGHHDDVAGLGRCRPRARSPVGGRARAPRPGPVPARISSMIASGSSERGLSEVTTTRSASATAAFPISGRFARSRSPPAPKTTCTRPSVSSRAARSTLSSASGVCA